MKVELGKRFTTTQGYDVEIININENGVTCKFIDSGTEITRSREQVRLMIVPNPDVKSNKFNGFGLKMKYRNEKERKIRDKWYSLLKRIEDDPHYNENVSICDEWYIYDNFYNWVITQTGWEVYSLDKDILQPNQKHKIYSPDTCIFVPQIVNTLVNSKEENSGLPSGISRVRGCKIESTISITNNDGKSMSIRLGRFVHDDKGLIEAFVTSKIARELKLQVLARRLYENKLINKRCYEALMNYRYYSIWIKNSDVDSILKPETYDKFVAEFMLTHPTLTLGLNEMCNELNKVELSKLSKLIN